MILPNGTPMRKIILAIITVGLLIGLFFLFRFVQHYFVVQEAINNLEDHLAGARDIVRGCKQHHDTLGKTGYEDCAKTTQFMDFIKDMDFPPEIANTKPQLDKLSEMMRDYQVTAVRYVNAKGDYTVEPQMTIKEIQDLISAILDQLNSATKL